jgi:hypothetical protein
MQYTIRNIPPAVDKALRKRARAAGKSLNEVAVEALRDGAGLAATPRPRRDVSDLIGSWKPDQELLDAIADQDRIDEEMWK